MTAVWMRLRSELRARIGATLGLATLVGISGAVVLTAVAGASRTDSAFDRFLTATRSGHVLLYEQELGREQIRALPQVADTGGVFFVFLRLPEEPDRGGRIVPFAAADEREWRTIDRGAVVTGRRPRPDRIDEVAISPGMAERRRLRPGSVVRAQNMTLEEAFSGISGGPVGATGAIVTLRVAGVMRQPADFNQSDDRQDVIYLGGREMLYLTPAYFRAYVAPLYGSDVGLSVRLHGGYDAVPSFKAALERLKAGKPVLQIESTRETYSAARRAMHLQAAALMMFAGLASAAAVFIVGQALVRQIFLESVESPVLRALGMSRRQLVMVSMLRSLIVGLLGAAIAAGMALVASPLMPIGLARQAEPDPGVALSAGIACLGAAAIVATCGLLSVWPSWRAAAAGTVTGGAAEPAGTRYPSRAPAALARWGAPPAVVLGVRMAFEPGRGRTAVPVRTALAGAVLALAAITTAYSFGASLDRLGSTPSHYGWTWDVIVGNPNSPDMRSRTEPLLARNADVGAYSAAASTYLTIDGAQVPTTGFDTSRGAVLPPVVAGREPAADDEIVLGSRELRKISKRVGELVTVRGGDTTTILRVVGRNAFDIGGITIGHGAMMTMKGFHKVAPDIPVNLFFVRYRAGVPADAGYASMRRDFGPNVLRPIRSADLENMERIRWMPYALSALLLFLGAATLLHFLATSVRRRSRDLAVLRTMGFVRRQLSAAIAWQATALAAASVVVGIPLGIAAGRWSWKLVADQLGLVAHPVTPLPVIAAGAAGALMLANVLTLWPVRRAHRLNPSAALRTE